MLVTLVQFTSHADTDFGHRPELLKWYRVNDMNDEIYWSDDNGDDEYFPAIQIITGHSPRRDGSLSPILRRVMKEETEHNTITIELDDNSQLFI